MLSTESCSQPRSTSRGNVADEPKYETTTVRAIRGTENRVIAKHEQAGWELLGQTPGRLRSELSFRRTKKRLPKLAVALGAAAIAAVVSVVAIGALTGSDKNSESAAPTPSEVASETTDGASSDEPVPDETAESASPEALTVDNSPELAALLSGPQDGDSVAAFAATNTGRTIEFDGAIAAMNQHDGFTTRYDILIASGDYSETEFFGGPNFQFRDVNVVSDLGLVVDVPDTIGVGVNVRVSAEVIEYEPATTLFLLDPVATQVR